MATEVATRPPAFVDGETLSGNDLRLNVLSGAGAATPLASRAGVRPSGGNPGLTAALATPVMKVRVNAGIADIPSTSVTGGFYRVSWDQVDLDIDNSSAQARTDLAILEVVDDGTAASTGKVRILKGTSGAGRPTNGTVNAHWWSLAAVAVRVNAEGTGNIRAQDVTPERQFAVAPGAPLPVFTQAERDALTKYPNLMVTRIDTGDVEMVNLAGTAWVTVYDQTPLAPFTCGTTTATLNAGGDVNIPHGLGVTPSAVSLTMLTTSAPGQYGKAGTYAVLDSTNIPVRVYDTRTGAPMGSFASAVISWVAFR